MSYHLLSVSLSQNLVVDRLVGNFLVGKVVLAWVGRYMWVQKVRVRVRGMVRFRAKKRELTADSKDWRSSSFSVRCWCRSCIFGVVWHGGERCCVFCVVVIVN
jgi:hypothetical protein